MKTRKKSISVLLIIGVVVLMTQLSAFKPKPAEDSHQSQTKWKNLTVLPQDISKDSLNFLMDGYSNALSVNCDHCHAVSKDNPKKLDFASDDKIEKEIARGMIHMTDEINKNFFQPYFPDPKPEQVFVVGCVMCHRGAVNPEKYLSKMGSMYKTYDPDRDNRKEKIIEEMQKK